MARHRDWEHENAPRLLSRSPRPGFSLSRFIRDESAGAAIMVALAVPAVFGTVGIAVDYSLAAAARTKMQAVADAAAINSAREFQMAQATPKKVSAVARSYVTSQLNDVSNCARPRRVIA